MNFYICTQYLHPENIKPVPMKKDFVEELTWRGMIHDMTPGVQEYMNTHVTPAYIGFDPTSDSLHIGSLVQIMTLVHLQRAGHKPVALVGGATGMVGDPSGKSAERNLLSADILAFNLKGIQAQLEKFLDFDCGENSAEIVNNYDWFKNFNFLDFIRDVGKHISVNYMMAKESVQKRLETGLSFTEFSYQLIQGYDFLWLYENKGCKVQLGGSDQWGNIVTGTELIRRKIQGEAFAMTTPLLKKADGSKFGKTEGGNVWLDAEKTSPYKFYQYWLNASDEDAENYIKIFTLMSQEEIEQLLEEHRVAPHQRLLQKRLAEDITVRAHSREDYETAVKASEILFGRSTTEDLATLDEKTLLSVLEGIPQISLSRDTLSNCENFSILLSDLSDNQVFSSRGEAKRMILSGGVSLNKEKIADPEASVKVNLLQNKYILAQKGKKNFYLYIIE
jgi:tyrosyl-tRNA synthetase